jgi:hypothetical protein
MLASCLWVRGGERTHEECGHGFVLPGQVLDSVHFRESEHAVY